MGRQGGQRASGQVATAAGPMTEQAWQAGRRAIESSVHNLIVICAATAEKFMVIN